MAIVLDTWALLAHLRDEPAGAAVRQEWVDRGAAMCGVNLGEALYLEIRARGKGDAGGTIEAARRELTVVDADWRLVTVAAGIKALGGLSNADAFCVATAKLLDAALWTGDPEIVRREGELGCVVRDLRDSVL